jgi:hypothetical protein
LRHMHGLCGTPLHWWIAKHGWNESVVYGMIHPCQRVGIVLRTIQT